MRSSHRFALSRANEENDTCGLTRDGVGIAETFDGTILDAQYELDGSRSVLCLGYDTVWDASFNIYLIGANGAIEDSLEGGGFFLSGKYEEKKLGDSTLEFKFFENSVVYRLSVLPRPRFRFSLPRPWRYKARLSAHSLILTALTTDSGKNDE